MRPDVASVGNDVTNIGDVKPVNARPVTLWVQSTSASTSPAAATGRNGCRRSDDGAALSCHGTAADLSATLVSVIVT
jgi:hypothetical protein